MTAQRWLFLVYAESGAVGFALAAVSLPSDPVPEEVPGPRRLRRAIRKSARFNVRGVAFPFTPTRMDVRDLDPRRFVTRFTPTLTAYFGAIFLFFVGFSAFFAPLPAYLTDVGFDTNGVFALYVVVNLAATASFRTAGSLATRYDVAVLQSLGLGTRALALPAVVLVGLAFGATTMGLAVTALVFVVIGLSWALIAVTAGTLVTRLSPDSIRGEALGIYSALSTFAGGVGSIVGGALAAWGYGLAFGVAGGLVAIGAVVVFLGRSDTEASRSV